MALLATCAAWKAARVTQKGQLFHQQWRFCQLQGWFLPAIRMTLASCKDYSASYYDDSAIYQHSLALKRMTINRDLSTGTALPFTFTTLQYLLQGQLCQLHTRMTLIPIGTDLLSTHYLAATRMPEGIALTSTRTALPFTLTTLPPTRTALTSLQG